MLVSIHILASLITALVLFPFIKFYAIIFFFAGFLIDVDHYLEYVFTRKKINPITAYKSFMNIYKTNKKNLNNKIKSITLNNKSQLHIFHTYEILGLIGIIGLFNKFILFIFFGFLFHFALDMTCAKYYEIKHKKKFCSRTHSLIVMIKNKK
jgi:hypothetical protein